LELPHSIVAFTQIYYWGFSLLCRSFNQLSSVVHLHLHLHLHLFYRYRHPTQPRASPIGYACKLFFFQGKHILHFALRLCHCISHLDQHHENHTPYIQVPEPPRLPTQCAQGQVPAYGGMRCCEITGDVILEIGKQQTQAGGGSCGASGNLHIVRHHRQPNLSTTPPTKQHFL